MTLAIFCVKTGHFLVLKTVNCYISRTVNVYFKNCHFCFQKSCNIWLTSVISSEGVPVDEIEDTRNRDFEFFEIFGLGLIERNASIVEHVALQTEEATAYTTITITRVTNTFKQARTNFKIPDLSNARFILCRARFSLHRPASLILARACFKVAYVTLLKLPSILVFISSHCAVFYK